MDKGGSLFGGSVWPRVDPVPLLWMWLNIFQLFFLKRKQCDQCSKVSTSPRAARSKTFIRKRPTRTRIVTFWIQAVPSICCTFPTLWGKNRTEQNSINDNGDIIFCIDNNEKSTSEANSVKEKGNRVFEKKKKKKKTCPVLTAHLKKGSDCLKTCWPVYPVNLSYTGRDESIS